MSANHMIRVLSSEVTSFYHERLYRPLANDVETEQLWMHETEDPERLRGWDCFHMHWPEWYLSSDVQANELLVDRLRAAGVKIVWTQHNLGPHDRDPALTPVYELWASVAHGVSHHSSWGMRRAMHTYRYAPDAVHRVVPLMSFGDHAPRGCRDDGSRVEAELGLRRGRLRLGVIGSPRAEKRVDLAMDAVASCRRDDVELLVLSLADGQTVPDDPRIVAIPYENVPRPVFDRRLQVLDAVVLPFDTGMMLTTGTVGDVVGAGLPALVSDWEYLAESLGPGGIAYGSTAEDLAACIDDLDRGQLELAAAAVRALQPLHRPDRVASLHLQLLREVISR